MTYKVTVITNEVEQKVKGVAGEVQKEAKELASEVKNSLTGPEVITLTLERLS